jgi:N-acetylneuraminic acid mutarotase
MMAGMKTEIANQNTKIANINKNHANTNTSIANVRTEIANVRTEIADVNRKMANIDTKMANTDTKLENMDTKLENMDTKMTNLQVNVEAKFEAMNNEVRGMKMSLNEVKDGFDHLKEAVLEKIESKERKQGEITRDVSGTASGGRENQHIFVAGGWGRNSVEIFNCRRRLWSLLKPMPESRNSACSFLYNNHVTLAGGFCEGAVDNMIRMNIHPVPDLSINWSDFAAKLPAKTFGHSSVVYKDSLLVTGGYNGDQDVYSDCIHEVQLKPPHTVKLVSKMPEPRIYHNTILCDDSILIVGGRKSGNCEDNFSSVLSYDIKKNECQQCPALPYPVSEMATVKWAENVVIIGGADKDGKTLNNVIIYNIKTGNSHMLPPMLHKRKGCMAVVIENTIVVLGGRDERYHYLKSVEGFNFERFSWEELPDMKETRWLATAVVI